MKPTSVVGAILMSALLLACASSTDGGSGRVVMNRQPIQGGQEDPLDTNVVGLFVTSGGMCTGTLVAPNVVLTAQHCLAEMTPDLGGAVQCGVSKFGPAYSGKQVYVSTDMTLSQQSDFVQGAEVSVPSEGNDGCGFDVALVRLSQSIDIEPRVPRIDLEPQPGEQYKAVGYGVQGTSGWGGTRMARDGLILHCVANACPSYSGVQSTEFMGETGICSGDSGGPALDVNGKVIGVVSRGLDPCDEPTYGSVSVWRDWIMAFTVEAAAKGGYPPPFWALSGKSDPEPDPGGTGGQGGQGGAQGQLCNASAPCPSGYGCLVKDDPEQGECSAFCDANAACGSGLTCDASLKVCLAVRDDSGASSGSNGGCALARERERGPVEPLAWLAGAAVLAVLRRRRWVTRRPFARVTRLVRC